MCFGDENQWHLWIQDQTTPADVCLFLSWEHTDGVRRAEEQKCDVNTDACAPWTGHFIKHMHHWQPSNPLIDSLTGLPLSYDTEVTQQPPARRTNELKSGWIYKPSGSNCEGLVAAIFNQMNSDGSNRETNVGGQTKAVECWATKVRESGASCALCNYF